MARMRAIKPGFFTNDLLAEIEPLGRLLFAGLWTLADRRGRLEDRPRKIKAEVVPYDDCDADALLDALAVRGFIVRYVADGTRLIQVCNWEKHQQPHVNERESDSPAPVGVPEQHSTGTVLLPKRNGTGMVLPPAQNGSNTPLTEQNRTKTELEPELEDAYAAAAADARASPEEDSATARDSEKPDVAEIRRQVDWVWQCYRDWVQPDAVKRPDKQIRARLKTFSVDQLTLGIQHFRDNTWCMDHNANKGGEWFFASDKRSEMYLHMEPDARPEEARRFG